MKRYPSKRNKLVCSRLSLLCLAFLPLLKPVYAEESQPKRAIYTDQRPVEKYIPFSLSDQFTTNSGYIARFYEQRQWQSIWDEASFTALILQIKLLKSDGLNPSDYFLTQLESYKNTGTDKKRAIDKELLATKAYLLALHHLAQGKVDPEQINADRGFAVITVDEEKLVRQAREAVEKNHIDQAFDQARPSEPRYHQLRAALTDLRRLAERGGWPPIPEGKTALKPNSKDPRIPLLRQRLEYTGLIASNTGPAKNTDTDVTYFDEQLASAVKYFQQMSYLNNDGVVGKNTLEILNVPVEKRIDQVRANLERLRWRQPDLKGNYVLVDVAAYQVAYMQGGKALWQSRIQVGKAARATPSLQSSIGYITLNPKWTVPPTILRKDVLPAIRKDINYLAEHHIRVFNRSGKEIAPETVYWADPGPITLRQDAGVDASLGQLAIRFPNTHSVYLHETPHEELFKEDRRTFSSGCIRVENVRELAVLLLNDKQNWTREKLEAALNKGTTREVRITQAVPILITYSTTDIAADGSVRFRQDIYKKDKAIIAALDNTAQ